MTKHLGTVVLVTWLGAGSAAAQSAPNVDVFLRGVPAGQPTAVPLRLTLADAVQRGLANNLGALLEEQRVRAAEGSRWRALSELLPRVTANLRQSDQVVNLAAFGFTGFAGLPQIIGPFGVFDARIGVSTPLFDATALGDLRADTASLRAEEHAYANARELVILAVANLYLETLADASRVENARSQVVTAEALARLAEDERTSGMVAGIDVLRQQVQLEAARQRLIVAQNALDKQRLNLARAIGLPLAQSFELADTVPYAPAPPLTLEGATAEALIHRADLKGAEARTEAARAARQAAVGGALPTVRLDADYGALGSSVSAAKQTYTVAADVRIPIFEGGETRGKVRQADAALRQREAELAELKAGIQFEIAAALMDVTAAEAAIGVARHGEALARQQLDQVQDRFRAGIANTIELVQAQEALAAASDAYIASLYGHNVAKATLARALGVVEERFSSFLGGQR
jgi:outer membrane protein TolC